jgi:protein SCO1/2
VHGQVIAIDAAHSVITIKHDDIQGFMPAMTMPYNVTDPAILRGLTSGDIIDATLLVFGSGVPKLSTITRTGHAALPQDAPSPMTGMLQPGDVVPDNPLKDLHGATRRLTDWRNQTLAVTFIYTRCPMPEFCPLMDRQFAAVQRSIRTDPSLSKHVRLVSITFDPEHDTPSVLAAHAKTVGADPAIWTFLTGAPADVRAVATAFGVSVAPDKEAPQVLTHNLRTAVIDGGGRVVKIYNGSEWTPDMLLQDLRGARAE